MERPGTSYEWFEEIIKPAIDAMYDPSNMGLLGLNVNERTLVSHIGFRMERLLCEQQCSGRLSKCLRVDVEYNRHGTVTKTAYAECGSCNVHDCPAISLREGAGEKGIYPDIVIHKRNSDEANEVVLEFKKCGARPPNTGPDRAKLSYLTCTKAHSGYGYHVGYLVVIGKPGYKVTEYVDAKSAGRWCFHRHSGDQESVAPTRSRHGRNC